MLLGGIEAGERPSISRAATAKPTVEAPPQLPVYEPPTGLTPEQQAKYTAAIDKANAPFVKHAQAEDLLSRQRDMAETVQNDVRSTHKAVRGALNERWEDVRSKTAGVQVPTKPILDAIDQSRQMLAGVPADLRIFNQIVDYARDAHLNQVAEAAPEAVAQGNLAALEKWVGERPAKVEGPADSIPFNDARVQRTALGEQWSNADGVLRRALKNVYDSYDNPLKVGAEGAGIGPEYGQLNKDWSQYIQDWQGKGPLAKVLKAPHPNYVTPIVLGRGGELLGQQYGRYADPSSISQLQKITKQAKVPPSPRMVPVPLAEVPKPKPHPVMLHAARIAGKVVGGTVGTAVGHPLIGYSAGGEAGAEIARRLAARRPPPSPEAYQRELLRAKEGEISPGEADRRIAKMGGRVRVRPIPQPTE